MIWPLVLLVFAAVVAAYGEPRPVALVIAGAAAITAIYDITKELDQ